MDHMIRVVKIIVLTSTLTEALLHCGENALRIVKIIGGKDVLKSEFPWQAALRWRVGMTKGDHVCGGSLIHLKYVLTAAHCFELGNEANYYNVILGDHNRNAPEQSEQTIRIKKITIHPNYGRPVKYDNDIALIELETPAILNTHVNTICLPTFVDFEFPNRICTITGWGGTAGDKDTPSQVLQKAKVPIVRFSKCNNKQSYNGRLSHNMFCAGYADGRMDSCLGDSGGPLQCMKSGTGYYVLQGVTSFGDGCGEANKYGVYTVVRHYLKWIHLESKGEVIIPVVPPIPKKTTPPVPKETKQPTPPMPKETKQPIPPIPKETKQPTPPMPKETKQPTPPIPTEPQQRGKTRLAVLEKMRQKLYWYIEHELRNQLVSELGEEIGQYGTEEIERLKYLQHKLVNNLYLLLRTTMRNEFG